MRLFFRDGASGRPFDRGLILLALRRSLAPGVVAWMLCVLVFTLVGGGASRGLLPDGSFDPVAAGLARESVWYAFVLGVVPLLVVRTVSSVVPWRVMPEAAGRRGASHVAASRHGDAPWLATRAVSNATIVISTWTGCALAGLLATACFALAAESRGGSIPTPVAIGTLERPHERWATSKAPLAWRATLPAGLSGADASEATSDSSMPGSSLPRSSVSESAMSRISARIELGLGAGAGAAAEVELRARRGAVTTASTTRIGNRGTVEVVLPHGRGDVELELACKGEDARVCILSDHVELWSLPSSSHRALVQPATTAIFGRLALSLAAWLAIAIGVSRFVSPMTAALCVLCAWIPHWWAEAGPSAFSSRWLPGVDLFDALGIVGDGRAPSAVRITAAAGSLALVAIGLVIACIGLRTWRVSR
jgi:hypothetical protein